MPSDLKELLDRAADRPSSDPDFGALARAGRRRRHRQRAASALAVVAVLALSSTVVVPRLRQPSVAFHSGPRDGVGSWAAVPASPIGARTDAQVAADDQRIVVMGGQATLADGSQEFPRDGAVFDVGRRAWTRIPAPPLAEIDHMELLDDGRLMVLQGAPVSAAFFDFRTRQWDHTSGGPVASRTPEAVVWTGDTLLVWGGSDGLRDYGDGAVWSSDSGWRTMAAAPLEARSEFTWTWTGDRLLVWGGGAGSAMNGESERAFADGAAYDPATDRWTAMADSPLAPRQGAQGLWTGDEWIVVGGYGAQALVDDAEEPTVRVLPPTESCDALGRCTAEAGVVGSAEPQLVGEEYTDGARYDPTTDEWTPLTPAPAGSRATTGVAYDTVIAYGRQGYAEYDADSQSWATRPSPEVGAHLSAWDAVAVGDRIVLLNSGPMVAMGDTMRPRRLGGVVYSDQSGLWEPLAEADTPQRHGAALAAVGDRLFVWGGTSVTRDISEGYQGGDPWHQHEDGAILTLD